MGTDIISVYSNEVHRFKHGMMMLLAKSQRTRLCTSAQMKLMRSM